MPRIGDFCEVIDGPHATPRKIESGKVYLGIKALTEDGQIDSSQFDYLSEGDYEKWTRRVAPQYGDIVFSYEATLGRFALVPQNLEAALGRRLAVIRPDKSKVNVEWLYYFFRSPEWKKTLLDNTIKGSTVNRISIDDFPNHFIQLPSKEQQEKTVVPLSLFDKAIKTNREINDNLHQMVQAIYLHMFFGRKPNARLGDLLIEHPKSTVQVNDAKGFEGAYPFFTSGEAILRWNEPMTTDSICLLNTGGNADVKFYAGAAAYSTDTWCISATEGLTEYLYMLLQTIRKELDIKFFTGTGLKHLQKPLLKERPVYQPTSKEAVRFNQIATPAMALISENIRQNCELQALRDWLLPMLMNEQATVEATQPNYRLPDC